MPTPARSRRAAVSPVSPAAEFAAAWETRLGWVATTWRGGRLCELVFGGKTRRQALDSLRGGEAARLPVVADDPAAEAFARRLRAYAEGEREDFLDLPVAIDDLTEFQRRVIAICRRIPYGRTLTYGQLAAAAGHPRAARAAGSVMARNRIPLVIPCHRVIGAGGSLCGYSGPDGLAMKQRLLELEQAGASER